MTGLVFTAEMHAVAVSAAASIFSIQAPAGNRVRVREIRIGQYSDFGDAAAEIVSVRLIRNATAFATQGGVAVTPQNLKPWSRAANSRVIRTATVATDGGKCVLMDAMNIASGWWYAPSEDEMVWLDTGDNLQVCVTAPADALTMNGTVVFEELAQRVD